MTNRTDTYQGHLPDGSSVQAHSAGGLYPFVLFAKDGANGKLAHGYIDPRDGTENLIGDYDQTVALVVSLKLCRAAAAKVHAETGLLACDTPVPDGAHPFVAAQDAVRQRANLARQALGPNASRHDYLDWKG